LLDGEALPEGTARVCQEYSIESVQLFERQKDETGGPWAALPPGVEVVEERELASGIRGQRRADPDDPQWSTWTAALDTGDLWLVLEVEAHQDELEETLDVIRKLAAAYVLSEEEDGPVEGDVFHLEHGAVALAPAGTAERMYARFTLPCGGELSITTEVPAEQETETALQRWPEIKQQLAAAGVKAEAARARPRTVGGMAGEELVFSSWQRGLLRTSYFWSFGGDVGDGARPRAVVQMESPQDQQDGLAAWDRLLDAVELGEPGGSS